MKKLKIDLSPENVAKTYMFHDTKLLVNDYTPLYKTIEFFESDSEGRFIKLHLREIYPWKEFKNKFWFRRILSVHNYDDTKTTSICLERIVS